MNKTRILAAAITAALALSSLTGCEKVPAGNVGVKVYLLGSSKGVDVEELTPGRYWIGINEELYLFPTFQQNYTWTYEWVDDNNDGKRDQDEVADESIAFQTKEGLGVSADIGISYTVDPTKVSVLFQKYRKGIDEITDLYLRNMVRDTFVKVAGSRSIEDVYGAGKEALLKEVEDRVRTEVAPFGIIVEKLYWAGSPRLPQTVVASINAKIEATQKAQQRENEIQQTKAEAEKQIEAARGEAESRLINAKAEADAIRIKGEALAENPKLVELSAIEKWNGVLPTITGGAVPFVNVPVGK
jgi:regulator of protease activity HflC (stomatin/prohibitin superfamily)